jgi:hypothetical protein
MNIDKEKEILNAGFQIHKLDNGYIVVDPLDNEDGYSLYDTDRKRLIKDAFSDLCQESYI